MEVSQIATFATASSSSFPAKQAAHVCRGRASGYWFSLTLPVSVSASPLCNYCSSASNQSRFTDFVFDATGSSLLHGDCRQRLVASFVSLGVLREKEALAVSYEDVVGAATTPQQALPSLDFDAVEFVNSFTSFVSENSLAVVTGAVGLSVLVLLSKLLSGSKNWGSVSAKDAFQKLGDEEAELLDIRYAADIKVEGTPDIRAYKKRVVQIPYLSEDNTFVQRVVAKFKDPSNTIIYILDRFDGNSPSVAKLLAANGFRAAYSIKNGAEGPNGWQKSQLPWLMPQKGFTFDVSVLKDVIDSAVNENPNLVPATLGVAAAAGVGLAVFSEVEAVLQLVGSAALVQLFVKKFLFAEDRKKTLRQLESFLNTKVAPKELVNEIKAIGQAVPKSDDRSLKSSSYTATSSLIPETSKLVPEGITEKSKDKTFGMTGEDKSAESQILDSPVTVSRITDHSQSTKPLSPYAQYPDLKPPTSPQPSRP